MNVKEILNQSNISNDKIEFVAYYVDSGLCMFVYPVDGENKNSNRNYF